MSAKLTAAQSRKLRNKIVEITRSKPAKVTPQLCFFSDLGGTLPLLKSLKADIETMFDIAIEPVDTAVTRRIAVNLDGEITPESLVSVYDYLNISLKASTKHPSMMDLITIEFIEAMVAKSLQGVPATIPRPTLKGELKETFYGIVASCFHLDIQSVHAGLDLGSLRNNVEDWTDAVGSIITAGKMAAGIHLDQLWPTIVGCIENYQSESTTPEIREACAAKLRELVPDLDLAVDGPVLATVGFLDRILAIAIEAREGASASTKPRRPLFGYLTKWTWADQDWWLALPQTLGPVKFRLLVCGILREYYLRHGDAARSRAISAAEEFAQTGQSPEELLKRRNALSSWRGSSRYAAAILMPVVNDVCEPEDCAIGLEAYARRFDLALERIVQEIKMWLPSLNCPLPTDFQWESTWLTPEIVALATQINEMRIYVDFPKLGELLKAGGCQEPLILDHCSDQNRRHLRGDWLLEGIIKNAPAKGTEKRSKASKIAKPKKPKFVKLSSSTKRELKEHIADKMAGIPLATAWSIAFQPGLPTYTSSWEKEYPNASPEMPMFLDRLYPALRTSYPKVAIARRIHFAQVDDLVTSVILDARIQLAIKMLYPGVSDLFETLFAGFISNDPTTVSNAVTEQLYSERMEGEPTQWSYAALRAIATRDEKVIRRVISRCPHTPERTQDKPIDQALWAILNSDTQRFSEIIDQMLEQERAEPWMFGICLNAHGLYRVAEWRNPSLIQEFNIEREFPWDAEFHSARESISIESALDRVDWSNVFPPFADYLRTGTIPQMLREVRDNCLAKKDIGPGMQITSIGPSPEKVLNFINKWLGTYEREQMSETEFAHRSSLLPMILVPYGGDIIHEKWLSQLRETGAEFE